MERGGDIEENSLKKKSGVAIAHPRKEKRKKGKKSSQFHEKTVLGWGEPLQERRQKRRKRKKRPTKKGKNAVNFSVAWRNSPTARFPYKKSPHRRRARKGEEKTTLRREQKRINPRRHGGLKTLEGASAISPSGIGNSIWSR